MRTWKTEILRPCGENDRRICSMRTWKMKASGQRKIGRPKLRWNYVIQKDMKGTRVQRERRGEAHDPLT